MKKREDLWRSTLGRAWWIMCEPLTEWEGEQVGFSSSEAQQGAPCRWRLDDWCLTLTGKYWGTDCLSGRTENKSGCCIGSNCIPQTSHGCLSPEVPRGSGLPGSVGQAIKKIVSRYSIHTVKCTNLDLLINNMVEGWWCNEKFCSLDGKK